MSWKEYKEAMRDELDFYSRNPEFPIVAMLLILFMLAVIMGVVG